MSDYRVKWGIDVEADSPLQAVVQVAKAHFQTRILQGAAQTACLFTVVSRDGGEKYIDLGHVQADLSPEQLKSIYSSAHPKHGREDWVDAATNEDTDLGYWEWVEAQIKRANR